MEGDGLGKDEATINIYFFLQKYGLPNWWTKVINFFNILLSRIDGNEEQYLKIISSVLGNFR